MIGRVRALLSTFPEGRELEVAGAAIDAALLAVVESRLAGVPEGVRPPPRLIEAIARSCAADLGGSWSEERRSKATPEELAAHRALQDYWLLLAVGDVGC